MNIDKHPICIIAGLAALLSMSSLPLSSARADEALEEMAFFDSAEPRSGSAQAAKRELYGPISLAPDEKVKICAAAVHKSEHVLLARQVGVPDVPTAPRIPIQWFVALYGIDDLKNPLKEVQPDVLESGKGACALVNGFENSESVPAAIFVVAVFLQASDVSILSSAQVTTAEGETKMLLNKLLSERPYVNVHTSRP